MKRITLPVFAAATGLVAVSMAFKAGGADDERSPIYGIEIPAGYRDWSVVNVGHEAGDLNDFRVILGNAVAIKAFRGGTLPFPDGTIIARLASKYVPPAKNNAVFAGINLSLPGPPRISSLWSRIQRSTPQPAAGGLLNSQAANPTTRRCTKRASPAISPQKGTIWCLRITRPEEPQRNSLQKRLITGRSRSSVRRRFSAKNRSLRTWGTVCASQVPHSTRLSTARSEP